MALIQAAMSRFYQNWKNNLWIALKIALYLTGRILGRTLQKVTCFASYYRKSPKNPERSCPTFVGVLVSKLKQQINQFIRNKQSEDLYWDALTRWTKGYSRYRHQCSEQPIFLARGQKRLGCQNGFFFKN